MPESFKTPSYEDRPSSALSLTDYFTQHVVWILLPIIGFAAGFGLRKISKMPLLSEVAEGVAGVVKTKQEKTALRLLADAAPGYQLRKGEAYGAGLGGAYGTFRLWRANTKQQLEVDGISKNIEALRNMESGDSYLAQENAQLRTQIKFLERHVAMDSHAAQLESSREVSGEQHR